MKYLNYYSASGVVGALIVGLGLLRFCETSSTDKRSDRQTTGGSGQSSFGNNSSNRSTPTPKSPTDTVDRRPREGGAVKRVAELRKTSKYRPSFILFDRNGLVTSQGADAIGLSSDDRLLVQRAMSEFSGKIAGVMKNKIQKDDELSSDGVDAYRIPPFEIEAETHFGYFLDFLTEGLGGDRAWAIAKAVPVEQLAGGLGTSEIIFKVITPDLDVTEGLSEDEIRNYFAVSYERRDATTGKMISGGKVDWITFNRENFGILE